MATADNVLLNKDLHGRFPGHSRGSYVLHIRLSEEQVITAGRLADVKFPRGCYAYVGSAMGGVEARLNYHLKKDKKRHWHVDYLLEKADIVDVSICETTDRSECAIARALSTGFDSIPGFGSSDCHCRSHLFFDTDEERMKAGIEAAIASLSVLPSEEK